MKKTTFSIFYYLLFFVPFSAFSFETTIPSGSTYMGIKTDQQVHYILKNLIIKNYTTILYSEGSSESKSPLYSVINTLKKQGTEYIEVFSNPQWGILLKMDVKNYKPVLDMFMSILNEEGFLPKIITNNTKNIIISSQSPAFTGNNLYIVKSKTSLIISNSEIAVAAWEKRSVVINYQKEIQELVSPKKGDSPLFFAYEHRSQLLSQDHNSPYFVALYHSKKNPKIIEAKTLFSSQYNDIKIPSFIPKEPMVLFTSSASQFVKFAAPIKLEALQTINKISQSGSVDHLFTVLNNGDIFSFNEGKYDEIDAYLVLQSTNDKIEQLKKVIKSLPAVQTSKIGQYDLYKIIPRNRKDMPISALVYGDNIIFSYNLKALSNISKKAHTVGETRPVEINVDLNSLINKFPIITSLSAQYGLDIKNIKKIVGQQTISVSNNIKSQSFTLTLNK